MRVVALDFCRVSQHDPNRHAMSAKTVSGYGPLQRLLECCAMASCALLAAWSLWRLSLASGQYFIAVAFAAAICGWLAADLFSGFAHWAFDSWGSVRTPFVGNAFIRPFREHHADPLEMTRHDFVELNGSSSLACLPLLIAACVMPLTAVASIVLQALLVFTALGAMVTNQCHQWAHADEESTPAIVRWAQRRRLILAPEQHRLHHTAPFDSHFCMASGWLNAPLNALLRAWR